MESKLWQHYGNLNNFVKSAIAGFYVLTGSTQTSAFLLPQV